MTLSNEILKEIEDLSYRYMLVEEISIITDVSIDDLMAEGTEARKAFLRGRLMRKAEFNESLIQLSKQLSSPAMMMENKLAEGTRINDLRYEINR